MQSGITNEEARAYLGAHGYNEIAEHKPSLLAKLSRRIVSPISLMLLVAAVLSYVEGQDFDGNFILLLLALNIAVTLWQEKKADTAIQELNAHLTAEVKTLRDGAWQKIPARLLVPHDVIELRAGDVIPADTSVLEAHSASANEAALTGESLPKEKKAGDTLYSGSFVASGIMTAMVSATGGDTYFGKTLAKIDTGNKRSSLERQILRISQLLSSLALLAVLLLSALLWLRHTPVLEILRLDLSLVIAGIPISLPTVMTLIIAFGVIALAKKDVVVRRLSSLEDLADTDYLLTDKTGTLTENKISVGEILAYGHPEEELLGLAAAVAAEEPDSSINQAILARMKAAPVTQIISFVPGDSDRKRSTLTMQTDDGPVTLSFGTPQVIIGLSSISAERRKEFDADVNAFAERGYRSLALARVRGERESDMELLGLIGLSDTLRADAKDAISFLADNGVGVSMVTGDNRAIAKEIAGTLSIPGARIETPETRPAGGWGALSKDAFEGTQAFAEILPEDKYELVKSAKRFYTVAANGDGVNDLPAVKEAHVGFAVKNAVDALKGAADIVLLSDGIAVMRDAFIEGRKIFMRLYAYSIYRISESFRLIVTIAVLGFFVGTYPLSPLQLILIALLNDIPIISLGGDRVQIANRPSKLNVKEQFSLSILFGLVGVANSLLLYFVTFNLLHLPLPVVQTMFFLKLTVSGHLLIYVAHTKERWWRYLPSAAVIIATLVTQVIATVLAVSGALMPAAIPVSFAIFVWIWSLCFMQISELIKIARRPLQNQHGIGPGFYQKS
ncbi:plasma-membrane proton-efflux P-type ATPase [Patescibacteria group bacterium]|nr:plasma-membrane proton-efflux P-type ATPase [Patescibacteria group bacterium]